MSAGLLAPYRVLDLTDGRAELAAFIFAGFGADVIKVEPPGGVDSRQQGPMCGDDAGPLASLHFQAYNRGKRSVVVDLDDTAGENAGKQTLLNLVATADFVIENAGPGVMDERGLGYEALCAARPDLVYVALSPFGQTGPYADHLATDITLSAMGGQMALTGDLDRRPVRITVPQTWHHAAAESVVGALVAHERRRQTGEPQFVDMAVQAAVFWTGLNAMIAPAIDGKNMERTGTELALSTIHTELVLPSSDGEVCLFPIGPVLRALVEWMSETGPIAREWLDAEDWKTFERRTLDGEPTVHSFEEVKTKIAEFTSHLTKAELFAGALERNITIVPVNTAADTVAMEHLEIRECWDEVLLASGESVRAPGAFVKISGAPVTWQRPAPLVGEHTDEVLAGLESRPTAGQPSAVPAKPKGSLPLEGIKVADFSWIGVGPITAKALADHGATVVRIESETRPDRLRLVGPFTNGEFGPNRCQFYGSFNTSKKALQLDLKHPVGNDVAKKMLAWCDIALDSFTAGTMGRLGLGYDTASELNPNIIMATTCLFGQYGPAAPVAGYGYHAAAISGFYEMTGWDDRRPGGPWNAYTDTVAPRFLTSTLLAALDHRRRTGEGQYIDQAQMESALHFQSPQLLDVQVSGTSVRRSGNFDPRFSPHDSYPCAGDDQWCAIAIENEQQWAALCGVIDKPEWAQDATKTGADQRRSQSDAIDLAVSAFTSQHSPHDAMKLLQRAGVPAGAVQRASDLLVDPQMAHRNFFRPMVHPEMGEVPYEGHQYRIAGYDSGPRSPAPCLNEHTFEVLTELLELDMDEAVEILGSGACG